MLSAFLAFVTLVGAFATVKHIQNYDLHYIIILAASGFILSVIILYLRGGIVQDFATYMITLMLFSSYLVKLLLIVVDPTSPVTLGMLPRIGMNNPDVPALLIEALDLTFFGILSFFVVSIIFVKLKIFLPSNEEIPLVLVSKKIRMWWGLWIILFFLCVISAGFAYKFDVGLMGSKVKQELPFHLRGVIFYFRSIILTGLILFLALLAQHKGKNSHFWLAIGLLTINFIFDSIIRSSKSSLLIPLLYTFLLMIVAQFHIKKRYIFIGIIFGVILLNFLPYMNVLRVYRMTGNDLWDAISLTISETEFSPLGSLFHYIVWIIYRLPGIEMLIGILGHYPFPEEGWRDILSGTNGVSGYLTNQVMLTPIEHPHLSAPSYFGWWYLMFGKEGVFAGGAVLALVVRVLWPIILKIRAPSSAIIRVYFLMILFTASTEGTLDMMTKTVIAMVVTVIIIEFSVRIAQRFDHICFSKE